MGRDFSVYQGFLVATAGIASKVQSEAQDSTISRNRAGEAAERLSEQAASAARPPKALGRSASMGGASLDQSYCAGVLLT